MSQSKSIVYRNIFLYRLLLTFIYSGYYRRRFKDICTWITLNDKQVLELCFGDIYIAKYVRSLGNQWTGLDINESFINSACKKGFDAQYMDISSLPDFPKSDVCIIAGSLYHFHSYANELLLKMMQSSGHVIISEPVKNLSSSKGLIGWIARRSANAGKGDENFRYNESSLLQLIEDFCIRNKFTYKVRQQRRDMVIEILKKIE